MTREVKLNPDTKRLEIIDFLRAIPILGMMLVGHFTGYYHFSEHVEKWSNYAETEMDLFLFCAGFIVGCLYYPRFLSDRWGITKKLLNRALKILLVQYLLILTINLPFYYMMYDHIRERETIWLFLGKSALFLNQIGIIHILPTFIPMFMVSPVILFVLSKGKTSLLLLCSLSIFAIGNKYPYLLDLGEKTIFPFILWQVYFVAGCLVGKQTYLKKQLGPANAHPYLVGSTLWLICFLAIRYFKIIPPSWVSQNPLNFLGLLYRSSIIFFILAFTIQFSSSICKSFVFKYPALFGRNALLSFVLHLYWARIVAILNRFLIANIWLNYFLILILGPFLIYIAVLTFERRNIPIILKRLLKQNLNRGILLLCRNPVSRQKDLPCQLMNRVANSLRTKISRIYQCML